MNLWTHAVELFQSQASPASVLIITLLLLLCMMASEISSLIDNQRMRWLGWILNALSVPLGIVFIINAAVMLGGALK